MEIVGKRFMWGCCTKRPCQLVYEIGMVREFNGVPYALLVWTAWNKPDGAPQYRWVAVCLLYTSTMEANDPRARCKKEDLRDMAGIEHRERQPPGVRASSPRAARGAGVRG